MTTPANTSRHSTPQPPGALGVAARPAEMLAYLAALDAWLAGRRGEPEIGRAHV